MVCYSRGLSQLLKIDDVANIDRKWLEGKLI